MNLHPGPFDRMKGGDKTDELRLNDEKRQRVKVGDHIIFSKRPDFTEGVKVKVTSLKCYKSFEELYEGVKGRYSQCTKEEFINGMREYYSREDEEKFGALEIGIKLLRGHPLDVITQ